MDSSTPSVPYRRIGTILVERRLITEDELAHALAKQKESGLPLGEIVVAGYGVSRVELADVLTEQWSEAQRLSAQAAVEQPDPSAPTVQPPAEGELRVLLGEAQAARAELARKTDELSTRLAALESLVIGVSGALDELRSTAGAGGAPTAEGSSAGRRRRPSRRSPIAHGTSA